MGARGPAPGSGGRPRKATRKPNPRDGYVRETVGPASKGKEVYKHREMAGLKPGDKRTVDHKDADASNNKAANLEVVSRSENVRRENKRRRGKH